MTRTKQSLRNPGPHQFPGRRLQPLDRPSQQYLAESQLSVLQQGRRPWPGPDDAELAGWLRRERARWTARRPSACNSSPVSWHLPETRLSLWGGPPVTRRRLLSLFASSDADSFRPVSGSNAQAGWWACGRGGRRSRNWQVVKGVAMGNFGRPGCRSLTALFTRSTSTRAMEPISTISARALDLATMVWRGPGTGSLGSESRLSRCAGWWGKTWAEWSSWSS